MYWYLYSGKYTYKSMYRYNLTYGIGICRLEQNNVVVY